MKPLFPVLNICESGVGGSELDRFLLIQCRVHNWGKTDDTASRNDD